MNSERQVDNHRLVMLARAAAQHQADGNLVEYTRACGLLADMSRNEISEASRALAAKLAGGQADA